MSKVRPSDTTPGWYETPSSQKLSGRSRRDTQPELRLRRLLHAKGARYRLQVRVAPRLSCDLAFMRQRVAVFVDGCFWHGCPRHGRKDFKGPNARRWQDKLQRNRERDERATRLARAADWCVIRLWECEVNEDPEGATERVLEVVRDRSNEADGPKV